MGLGKLYNIDVSLIRSCLRKHLCKIFNERGTRFKKGYVLPLQPLSDFLLAIRAIIDRFTFFEDKESFSEFILHFPTQNCKSAQKQTDGKQKYIGQNGSAVWS